jgi:hypothetical protein
MRGAIFPAGFTPLALDEFFPLRRARCVSRHFGSGVSMLSVDIVHD